MTTGESRAQTIAGLNALPHAERLKYMRVLVPPALRERFHISSEFMDPAGRLLLHWTGKENSNTVEIALFHEVGAPDPLLYFHLTDTLNQQIHVLLTVLNDPQSPRFNVDKMPDGGRTHFGVFKRNVAAEVAAMQAGLAPGQIHKGLRALTPLTEAFEAFVQRLGHSMYFVEPLFYHNAVIFERNGFAYQQGRRWMQSLNTRFSPGGDLPPRLDGSTPFRMAEAAHSIRGRSWAIHDGILGEPFTGVTMYKRIGQPAGISTFPEGNW
ncbi:MAG: hypothetical protein HYY33_05295 [Chloroflexi bacterium]|nr:hypothetical protein [Chloroflexota bacterium]